MDDKIINLIYSGIRHKSTNELAEIVHKIVVGSLVSEKNNYSINFANTNEFAPLFIKIQNILKNFNFIITKKKIYKEIVYKIIKYYFHGKKFFNITKK